MLNNLFYLVGKGQNANPGAWTPLTLNPSRYYRADQLNGSGSSVAGFVNQGSDGVDATLAHATGVVLPAAINGEDAVQFLQPDVFALQNSTALIDKNTAFSIWGVCSNLSWYVVMGGGNSADSWTVNDGASTEGLHMAFLDPSVFPGYQNLIVFVGDVATPYVGCNGLAINLFNQYFSFVVNYNGGGDYGDPSNYEIIINGQYQTVTQSPAFNDQVVNPTSSFQESTADSTNTAWVEWGISTSAQITGSNYTGWLDYTANRYNLTPPTEFSPLDIAGMNRWYRDELYTGTTSSVTNILDKSGFADVLTNFQIADAGAPNPTVDVASLNGLDTYVFADNTQGEFATSDTFFDPAQPCTFAWVAKAGTWQPGTGGYQPAFYVTSSGGSPFSLYYLNTANFPTYNTITLGVFDGSTATMGCALPTYDSFHSFILTYNGGGVATTSNYELYIDGSLTSLSNLPAAGSPGNHNRIGGGNASNVGVGEGWAEWIMYDSQLTGTNLTNLISYFNTRYGL